MQAMEMKFFREILNKTKDVIRNTNIRLELGVDEMKNVNLILWKFILREYYYIEQKPEQQKEKNSRIQAMEITFLRINFKQNKEEQNKKY